MSAAGGQDTHRVRGGHQASGRTLQLWRGTASNVEGQAGVRDVRVQRRLLSEDNTFSKTAPEIATAMDVAEKNTADLHQAQSRTKEPKDGAVNKLDNKPTQQKGGPGIAGSPVQAREECYRCGANHDPKKC